MKNLPKGNYTSLPDRVYNISKQISAVGTLIQCTMFIECKREAAKNVLIFFKWPCHLGGGGGGVKGRTLNRKKNADIFSHDQIKNKIFAECL